MRFFLNKTEDGRLLCFGKNSSGQLGLGNLKDQKEPVELMKDEDIQQISCGVFHTILYKKTGQVFVMGGNQFGQLGIGNYETQNKPFLMMTDKEIENICCGTFHSLILKKNGELWVFGRHQLGQLGLGDTTEKNEAPVLLIKDENIKQIYCGSSHSFFLKKNGELFAFGNNWYGQLGIGDLGNRTKPVLVTKDEDIKEMYCGGNHATILKSNGELFTFGRNSDGQLGLGEKMRENQKTPVLMMKDEVEQISLGERHSMILKKKGKLFVFGNNEYGQLGLGDLGGQYSPVLLMEDDNIKRIRCGAYHSFIYKKNGELWVFGDNEDGQLGLGDKEKRKEPVLLMIDDSISILLGGKNEKIWTPQTHFQFPPQFKQRILLFILILKRTQNSSSLKIPKFVLFEIIKLTL